jgi:hypothetical protein
LQDFIIQLERILVERVQDPGTTDKPNAMILNTVLISVVALLSEQQVHSFTSGPFRHHPNSERRISNLLTMEAAAAPPETLTVTPIKSLDGTVTLPGSKSLSNRCLLLAALSKGDTRVDNLLDSDDIRYMLEALDTLKVPVERHSSESVTVTGQSGPIDSPTPEETVDLFLGNAGTAMRPLAAALCMGQGKFVLDGVPRMRERPIADLIDGLQQLGADITCVEATGCPPVTIDAKGLKGGKVFGWFWRDFLGICFRAISSLINAFLLLSFFRLRSVGKCHLSFYLRC